jgi:hypothetical protein
MPAKKKYVLAEPHQPDRWIQGPVSRLSSTHLSQRAAARGIQCRSALFTGCWLPVWQQARYGDGSAHSLAMSTEAKVHDSFRKRKLIGLILGVGGRMLFGN